MEHHRDDLIINDQYPMLSLHSEEEGVKIRQKIYKVTFLLSLITIIEVCLGIYIKQSSELWLAVKWVFIALTVLKAGYIVMVFMHLQAEHKNLRRIILYIYYLLIIYLFTILLFESTHQLDKINRIIF